jgi:hypothetical protein
MGSLTPTERVIAVLGSLAAVAALYLAWLTFVNSRPKESVQPSSPTIQIQPVIVQSAIPEPVEITRPSVSNYYGSEPVAIETPTPSLKVSEPSPEVKPQYETLSKAHSIEVVPPPQPSLSAFSSALLSATALGDHNSVKRWLDNGADPNATLYDGKTPLILATRNGHHDICKTLVLAGAEPTMRDQRGRNALHYAAEGGHNDLVTYLLDHGVPATAIDNEGNTPLTLAELGRHNTCASVIRKVLRCMATVR